ncbi:MAG: Trm112 family protein [Nakamurella multipartita]
MSAPGEGPARLDPVLLDVLACPAEHHAPLELGAPGDPVAAGADLHATRAASIRDGIPVLLDEATGGTGRPSAGAAP